MNKIIKTVVSGALAVTLFGGGMVFASSIGFTDTGWWSNVAQWANDRGLMTGIGNGIFGGDESLTRGQMAQVLKNLAGSGAIAINNSTAVTNNIGDFKDSGWWTASAKWAKDHGLMNGMGDGTFGGDQLVTRGQAAQVLKNLAGSGAITINNSTAVTNNLGDFKDSGWWSASAKWAKDHGLMNGMGDGTFGGDQLITRGQAAQVLKNLAGSGAITINQPTTVTNNSGSQQTATGSGSINQPTTVTNNSGSQQTATGSGSINQPTTVTKNSGSQQTATGSGSINQPATVTKDSGSQQTATGSGSINQPTTVTNNSGSQQTDTSPKGDRIISFEKYQQIQIGMTYSQVANLIGIDGVVQHTNPSSDIWYDGKGGYLELNTDNGIVTSKQEKNLSWESAPSNLPAQNTNVTFEEFDKIQMGMSEQQVLSIAGMCQSEWVDANHNTTFEWWKWNNTYNFIPSLTVEFDSKGNVIEKMQGNLDYPTTYLQASYSSNTTLVTPSTYHAIKTGMTYPEVVALFGGDGGLLVSQSTTGSNAGSLYTWQTDLYYSGQAINVLFGPDGTVSRVTTHDMSNV
ncbi:S-layer homology domain-containing protein [Paenibacillus sp. GP183]|uniref:S-layer homology domain-containing protein n=1 Tax=Paenibacillus sp. GP183 TaxID=1882751 RepID=UPI00089A782B|nr:S-layer homology domain-containing protein [Paenibacillus sp. GP183]SEB45868.1 S-layer homology domain-containing protein [Paenibacillus sp. GP183]